MKQVYKNFNAHYRKLSGEKISHIEKIKSGISERIIYRLESANYRCIGVTNNKPAENTAFIKFSKVFRNEGLNVPEILYISRDKTKYLISDLGRMTLYEYQKRITSKNILLKLYKKVLTDLIRFQKIGMKEIDFNLCYETKVFDAEQIKIDFNKFCDFYLSGIVNIEISRKKKDKILNNLNDILYSIPEYHFMYRDFQPRNIIIEKRKIGYVDYQSGRIGPVHYDLASFLYSGSININAKERDILYRHYAINADKSGLIGADELKKRFFDIAFLRLLQVLGSYGHSIIAKKRKDIIQKIPKAIGNMKSIKKNLRNAELVWLADIIISAEYSFHKKI